MSLVDSAELLTKHDVLRTVRVHGKDSTLQHGIDATHEDADAEIESRMQLAS